MKKFKTIVIQSRVISQKTLEYDVPTEFLEKWLIENEYEDLEDLGEYGLVALGYDIKNNFDEDHIIEDYIDDEDIMGVFVEEDNLSL